MILKKISYFFILYSIVIGQVLNPGFVSDTLVCTEQGFVHVESINDNSLVESRNFYGEICLSSVKNIRVSDTECIEIALLDTVITCDQNQRFYTIEHANWVRAADLASGCRLLCSDGSTVVIDQVKQSSLSHKIYDFTVSGNHNFFVTKYKICAHNFVIVIPLLTWGAGAISFLEGLSLASLGVAAGYAAYERITGHKTDIEIHQDGTVHGTIVYESSDFLDRPSDSLSQQNTRDPNERCWCGHYYCGVACGCSCNCICSELRKNQIFNEKDEFCKKQDFNFTKTTEKRMNNPKRAIPINILGEIISNPKIVTVDPQGTRALMYYANMWKNGKLYNVEVLYDSASNTIFHFLYSKEPMGPLKAIQ